MFENWGPLKTGTLTGQKFENEGDGLVASLCAGFVVGTRSEFNHIYNVILIASTK
jgi:hypothetical protein